MEEKLFHTRYNTKHDSFFFHYIYLDSWFVVVCAYLDQQDEKHIQARKCFLVDSPIRRYDEIFSRFITRKNVSEVSGYLNKHAKDEKGFILISAASHDAIIFSAHLPMKRFIHEGTGLYWENALAIPDRWARWIVMRTYDNQDSTWKGVSKTPGFQYYDKVAAYPFADVYELQASRSANLNTEPVLGKQK